MDDFSSMDRLMEMGMSMALANQMIGTMNQVISNMQMPGTPCYSTVSTQNAAAHGRKDMCEEPPEIPTTYAVVDGHMAGPLSDKQLTHLIRIGTLSSQTLVWRPGMTEWRYAADVPEVYKLILLNI